MPATQKNARPEPKPDSQILKMERTFDCTLDEMWAAWTVKEQYAKWISPFPGIDADVTVFEPKEGGRVVFTMVDATGKRYPEEHGIFEKIDKPREIVHYSANDKRDDIFAGRPQRMRARFEALGPKKTRVIFETNLPPDIPLEMARGGFGACFDKLEKLLSGSPMAKAAAAFASAGSKLLRLERTFDASPERLWAAWTDPKQYAKWFNPAAGHDLVIHEFDVRPGGKIRFDMPQPDGNKNPQSGIFVSLNPPRELVTGEPEHDFYLKTTFTPEGQRTKMVVEVVGVPLDWHAPAKIGWGQGFDKLEKLLASQGAR